jgi:hypothetical protein
VYALAVLLISAFAMSGRPLSLRLLLLVSLVLSVERVLTPLISGIGDMTSLGLHAIGALLALALAVVSASALRSGRSEPLAAS